MEPRETEKMVLRKRIFDLLITGFLLVVFAPILITVALLVRWVLGSPILFKQIRPGLHGNPFTIYKFRSMVDAHDQEGNLLPDEERLPAFGKLLRSLSLDELPELVNVMKGEMSLVGPRPLLTVYLDRYSQEQARRHDVPPGITGWAQVNGRNAISWDDKLKFDVWYVDHLSWWLDLKILGLTVLHLLRRSGISHQGHVTMPRFRGNAGRRS